jgi:tRNA (guanine-N7-)-methyltransferase
VRARRRPAAEELQPYLLDVPHPRSSTPPPPGPPLDWHAVFGRAGPVEIEVGSGKGLFLLNQSQARPDVNFLGVEIERKYVLHTATRLAKRRIANVRLACADARWLFAQRIAAGSVAAVHIYFPDPWWKTRHRKRRLFTPAFATEATGVLAPGGRLHFASDVQEYFEGSVQMLGEQKALRVVADETPPDAALTNFEHKYRVEGRPIYRAVLEKVVA